MVIGEAMRTFTYLNLYGYLTDAVIVNRVFPSAVGDYFAAWREVQERHLELVRSAFAPVPVICAPYFDQEVVGAEMLDRLAEALFDDPRWTPARCCIAPDPGARTGRRRGAAAAGDPVRAQGGDLSQEDRPRAGRGRQRARADDRASGALAGYRPRGARFGDGTLEVSFDGPQRG